LSKQAFHQTSTERSWQRNFGKSPVFEQITILAPGLLGASLGMALRRTRPALRIQVWARRPETRAACQSAAWCDAAFGDAAAACAGSGCVVLCPPVDAMPGLMTAISPALAPGTLVTDVGSTKDAICREAAARLPAHALFVGSHPMAGSEKGGMDHAHAGLFNGHACLITPTPATPPAAIVAVRALWQDIGMRVSVVSPAEHDQIVAHISHLPHMLASLLSHQLAACPAEWAGFAGNGLRDTTRVAGGSPDLWLAILQQNQHQIHTAVAAFSAGLQQFQSALAAGDWPALRAMLASGRDYRLALESEQPSAGVDHGA
jgi:cyclohexadieny/prephenate dehydrogenase